MAVCVLTGDIVGSTELPRAQQTHVLSILDQASVDLRAFARGTLDTYRGDGWQMSFEDDGHALRFALFIRASLRAENEHFDSRIAMAQNFDKYDPKNSNSPAFVASGRTLDAMPRDVFMAHASGGADHATTLLADHISRGWTEAQSRTIKHFLRLDTVVTQKQVAAHFGISRQAVGQALDAAGYPAIKAALAAIEEQAK